MKRVFIAINLPEEIIKELDNSAQAITGLFPEELKRGLFKWVKKDNLHITLLFIGEIKEDALPQIKETIQEIINDQETFSVNLKRVCYGPPKTIPPRLIWVELERNKDLERLSGILNKKMTEKGLLRGFKERGFLGHLTLARIRTWQWRGLEPEERPDIETVLDLSFPVNSVELMESVLRPAGAEYKIIESFPLRNAK